MSYFLAMRVMVLTLLLSALPAWGVEFPEITGKVSNQTGLDLADLGIAARVECTEANGIPCGTTKVKAKWDNKTKEFVLSSAKIGPDPNLNPERDRRYTYSVEFFCKSHKRYAWFHDLDYFSWEGRPGATPADLVKKLPEELAYLTFFAVHQTVPFFVSSHVARREYRLRYTKRFRGVHKTDVSKGWITAVGLKPERGRVEIAIPPIVFVLRGKFEDFGGKPRVDSTIYLYEANPRDGMVALDYLGEFHDKMHEFSPDAHFESPDPAVELED